ncbi:ketose-bisphosphate aldolase [Anaerotruncus rubiinfantis]|uniref:ketose-bisphosphate aldolase n=1 Tax=Anaerotruncus rubiinfantis TaxID=1720200 RepID=UPI0034A3D336
MLVNLKEILAHAEQENYTVLAANIFNMESLLAIAGAAEKEHAPIIMNIGQMRMRDEKLGSILTHAACELGAQVEVPVCINLDHGTERAVYMKAMDCGCTSIMVDGSMLSYEENVALTKEMVEIAHQRGISVEGEIGHVGQGADYTDLGAKDLLTAPEIARKFAEATGVDALAVAIGTAHGTYKKAPKIDYDRLAEIKAVVKIPLVLHGASCTGEDKLKKAADMGIRKINMFTEFLIATAEVINEAYTANNTLNYDNLSGIALKTYEEKVRHYINLYGGSGKAWVK